MNPMISNSVPVVFGVPAAGLIALPQFWTPAVRVAVGLETIWWMGALAFLGWLTRPSVPDKSQPPKPKRGAREESAPGAPPLAA
jgi:hypothetical protein